MEGNVYNKLRMGFEGAINILYVDDEIVNLNAFKATFRRHFNVYTAISATEGFIVLDTIKIDILISDQQMPGTKGIEFLKSIKSIHPKIISFLLTGYADLKAVTCALSLGYVDKCIEKPWSAEQLKVDIEEAVSAINKKT